jgi:hypothetical protein
MNVGDPTRKIPAFEEIYSREGDEGEQEFRSSGVTGVQEVLVGRSSDCGFELTGEIRRSGRILQLLNSCNSCNSFPKAPE